MSSEVFSAIRPKEKIKNSGLSICDTILALFIVTPCVLGFWRGTWGLMEIYSPIFPGIHSLFLGGVVHLSFALLRDILQEYITHMEPTVFQKIKSQVIRRIYTYTFTISCIMMWRGSWIIIDSIFEFNNMYTILGGAICLIPLVLLKSIRNSIAVPMVILLDTEDVVFSFPTRYKVKSTDRTSLYILDCLFSVFVIGTLVVFVWRGGWVLLDIFLFPDDLVWSSWVSLILGYTITAMAFCLQPAMRWLCNRLHGLPRVIVADLFLFFAVIGTINVWRGIWNLLETYFIPEHPELSCWTTHWVSLVLLILLNCSNSLLVRGVYVDAEEPAGKCVIFPVYYLRIIFKNERRKKQTKTIQLETMSKRKHEIDCLKEKNDNCNCNSEQNHVLLLQHQTELQNHIEV